MTVDFNELVTCLGATLSPDSQKAAEARLDALRDETGLVSNLMRVLLAQQLDQPVRQSAAILMKNLILERWDGRLDEADKTDVRANLLAGLLSCPQSVRAQLCHSLSTILRHDFPERWPEFGHSVVQVVQASVGAGQPHETTIAALLALYQLVKVYEFRRIKERAALNAVMLPLLPVLVERVKQALPDGHADNSHPAHVVHLIMKVFYAYFQFCIDQKIITHAMLLSVTESCHLVLASPVDKDIDHDEHQWKSRKWALQLLRRLFERYGRPSSVQAEYKHLAQWYLPAIGVPSMEVTMRMLAAHCAGQTTISPRCIHLCLSYLDLAVPVGACWRQLRSHFSALLEHVLFPLLCHSADDEEEWKDDPAEYVRSKYDDNNQLLSPQQAARSLLYTAASRRRGILQDLIQFVFNTVNTTAAVDPHRLDGALHALGAVGAITLRKAKLKPDIERFLAQVVMPLFSSPTGYLRARACWVIKQFANLSPQDDELLGRIVQVLIVALTSDAELPVRCEAGLALAEVASRSASVKKFIVPHLRNIMIALMETVNKTVSDEIVNALEQMLCEFANESKPIAAELAAQLATTFCTIVENAARQMTEHNDSNASGGAASLTGGMREGPDPDSAMAGLGLLSALDTLADAAEESQETLKQLEPSIWQVVNVALKHRFDDYYEEVLILAGRATANQVSPAAWAALELLEPMLKDVDQAGPDSFSDACFYLYNLLTVGKAAGPQLERICRLAADMLTCVDAGDDAQAHAAKMLEIIIMDQGEAAAPALPAIIEHVVHRLDQQPVDTEELKNQLTVVILAAVFRMPNVALPLVTAKGPKLLQDVFAGIKELRGIHDRRVAVLALCQVVRASPVESGIPQAAMPAIVELLDELQAAHKAKLKAEQAEAEDFDEELDEGDEEADMVDDDDEDEAGGKAGGKANGGRRRNRSDMMSGGDEEVADAEDVTSDAEGMEDEEGSDDDDDEEEDYEDDEWPETELEEFETWLDREEASHIDEYVEVADLFTATQAESGAAALSEPVRTALQSSLDAEAQRKLHSLLSDIEKRRAAVRSKMIQNRGGYSFADSLAVPTSFNFGPSTPPTSPP